MVKHVIVCDKCGETITEHSELNPNYYTVAVFHGQDMEKAYQLCDACAPVVMACIEEAQEEP